MQNPMRQYIQRQSKGQCCKCFTPLGMHAYGIHYLSTKAHECYISLRPTGKWYITHITHEPSLALRYQTPGSSHYTLWWQTGSYRLQILILTTITKSMLRQDFFNYWNNLYLIIQAGRQYTMDPPWQDPCHQYPASSWPPQTGGTPSLQLHIRHTPLHPAVSRTMFDISTWLTHIWTKRKILHNAPCWKETQTFFHFTT